MTIADTYIKNGFSKRANIFAKLTAGKWNPLHYVRKGAEWAFSGDDDAIALKLKSKDYKSNMQDWKRHNLMIDRSGSKRHNKWVNLQLDKELASIMADSTLSADLRNKRMAAAYAKAESNLRTVSDSSAKWTAINRRIFNPYRWFADKDTAAAYDGMLGAHYLTRVSSDDMLNPEFIRRQQNIAAASDYVLDGVKIDGKQVAIKDPALLARMTMIPDNILTKYIPGTDKMRLSGEQVDQHLNAAMDGRDALDRSGFQLTAYVPHASHTLNLGTILPAQYSPAISAYMQRSLMPRITNIPVNTATSMFNHIYQNDMAVAKYWADMLKRLGVSQ